MKIKFDVGHKDIDVIGIEFIIDTDNLMQSIYDPETGFEVFNVLKDGD